MKSQSVGPTRPSLRLGARLRSHVRAKVAVLLGLSVGICVPYFWLQRIDLLPIRNVPTTPFDEWIAFDPAWIWAYVSLALLVPLAPLLASERHELRRYARGLALLCLPCFAAFLLVPVAGPRPEVAPIEGVYPLIVSVDRPTNSLPSLHAGLTAFSLLFAYRVTRGALVQPWRAIHVVLGVSWGSLILFSTLATKQHWLLDLPAGIVLAWAADAASWRPRRSHEPGAGSR